MGAAGKYRVLDLSALDFDGEPVRVRSVENGDVVDGSLIQTFDPGQYAPVELVPDLSAGTAGSAIPAAGSAPRPAARYRGGRILPTEAPPIVDTTPLPPHTTAAPAPVRQTCGARARSSRGRSVRRRGSRRGAAATRAGPDDGSGDPEPGSSSGHLDRYALAGRPA